RRQWPESNRTEPANDSPMPDQLRANLEARRASAKPGVSVSGRNVGESPGPNSASDARETARFAVSLRDRGHASPAGATSPPTKRLRPSASASGHWASSPVWDLRGERPAAAD